jgi:NAD(P)-dependent dehydrogenase (short-subunit alcohol dehydrogenase family)
MARKLRSIAGRPAVITGAASGIGRSLARRLSRSGSPVAIADIDEAGLKDTAKSLPEPVLVRVLDVRDAADQLRFAAEVREWLASPANSAPLAAVFNNAGVAVASSVLGADPGDDEWLRQINFDGVVNGTRAFLPILAEQDDGVIVNTSSVPWRRPGQGPHPGRPRRLRLRHPGPGHPHPLLRRDGGTGEAPHPSEPKAAAPTGLPVSQRDAAPSGLRSEERGTSERATREDGPQKRPGGEREGRASRRRARRHSDRKS